MNKIVKKRIILEYFEKIASGQKQFDVRLANFDIKAGDEFVLEEVGEDRKSTGRKLKTKVKYVLKTKELPFWDQADIDKYGYQVIGFNILKE